MANLCRIDVVFVTLNHQDGFDDRTNGDYVVYFPHSYCQLRKVFLACGNGGDANVEVEESVNTLMGVQIMKPASLQDICPCE